ncbi:IS110 family transposase [Burkholderia ubonensis]|uniref:IS110 family transposase n=1 Tax=Burkholderia ubonensis TaxID=101571 RepID=UPI001E356E54|nr:IS110 family transposase [Burkholderia ubonensis]
MLKTVPGIGPILATVILLEVGSIERFDSAGNFASYARCVDSRHMSNGKKKGEGNTKNGNKYLSWAFIEAGPTSRCAFAPKPSDSMNARKPRRIRFLRARLWRISSRARVSTF